MVCLALLAADAAAGDWPSWRGPNRNGITEEKDWSADWGEAGPKRLWQKNVGVGCSSVVIVDGRLYSAGNVNDTDAVICLDALTGEEIWKHEYSAALDPNMYEGGPGATPVYDDGRVYMLSRDGDILCLDASGGKPVWTKRAMEEFGAEKPQWGFAASALVVGETVYFGVDRLVALDKKTGDVKWQSEKIGIAYSTPAVFEHDGTEYLASFGKTGLNIHKSADGSFVANQPFEAQYDVHAVTPVVNDDLILVSASYSKGARLSRFDGKSLSTVWEDRVMRNKLTTSVLVGDYLYGFDEQIFKCIEFKTGVEKWQNVDFGHGTAIVAGDKLIVFSEQTGELAIFKAQPDGPEILARHDIMEGRSWVSPAMANGRLYVKNNNGDLAALDLRS
jgi:outer membrane protein assembly factor BamB